MAVALDGAWARHARAQEHLTYIEDCIAAWRSERKVMRPEGDSEGPDEPVQLPTDLDRRISVRLGETVYNLRTSLEYAVFELSGQKSGTQFPLEDDPDVFTARETGRLKTADGDTKRIGRYLHGLSRAQIDLIEAVQPYNGIDWSKRLRGLSNEDKHRRLLVIRAQTREIVTVREVPALFPSPNLYPSRNLFPSSGYVETNVEEAVDVALPDGALISEALQELHTEVGALLAGLERT